MKPFLTLMGLSFKSLLLTTANLGRSKKRAVTGIGSLVLLSGVILYLSGVYSFMLGAALAPFGLLWVMLAAMMVASLFIPLAFTMFSSQGLLFSSKDIDLVFSLPLSSFTVLLARTLALYLEVLLMCELALLPAGVAWLMNGGPGGIGFILVLLVLGIFMALIPTALAMIFGCLISLISAKLPFKNLFISLFSILFVVLIMFFSFSVSSFAAGTSVADFQSAISSFEFMQPIVNAVASPGWLILLAICAASLVFFLLVTWFFSLFYRRLVSNLASHSMRRNYKLTGVSYSGQFSTLLKKEASRFFKTPAYLLNMGIGIVLGIVAAVAACVQREAIQAFMLPLLSAVPLPDWAFPAALVVFFGFFQFMTVPAAVSLSLEGKAFWIIKEAPLSFKRVFASKILFNFLLNAALVLVCTPMFGYAFSLTIPQIFAAILLSLLTGLLVPCLAFIFNLLFPRMDVENETLVIKQSTSVLLSMLAGLLLLGIVLAAGYGLVVLGLPFLAVTVLLAVLIVLLIGGCVLFFNTKGRQLYEELY